MFTSCLRSSNLRTLQFLHQPAKRALAQFFSRCPNITRRRTRTPRTLIRAQHQFTMQKPLLLDHGVGLVASKFVTISNIPLGEEIVLDPDHFSNSLGQRASYPLYPGIPRIRIYADPSIFSAGTLAERAFDNGFAGCCHRDTRPRVHRSWCCGWKMRGL